MFSGADKSLYHRLTTSKAAEVKFASLLCEKEVQQEGKVRRWGRSRILAVLSDFEAKTPKFGPTLLASLHFTNSLPAKVSWLPRFTARLTADMQANFSALTMLLPRCLQDVRHHHSAERPEGGGRCAGGRDPES